MSTGMSQQVQAQQHVLTSTIQLELEHVRQLPAAMNTTADQTQPDQLVCTVLSIAQQKKPDSDLCMTKFVPNVLANPAAS